MQRTVFFLAGLFVTCLSALMLQVGFTRLLSVIAYFHLTFLCISLAMLGMTAGAVWVYRRAVAPAQALALVAQLCAFSGLSALLAIAVLMLLSLPFEHGLRAGLALLSMAGAMALPFFFSGAIVTLCLIRVSAAVSIGTRYGVDLCGAALGCLLTVLLLRVVPTPAALILIALLPFGAALLFEAAAGPLNWRVAGLKLAGLMVVMGGVLLVAQSPLLYVTMNKNLTAHQRGSEIQLWNAHSLIALTPEYETSYSYWGRAKDAPEVDRAQRLITIDGMAATPMYKHTTDAPPFHQFDVTNVAYAAGRSGRAAIIGIGGGRDALAARAFGFESVTVVEMNAIIIDLLTRLQPYRDYAGVAADPKIQFHVDEARSWFARTNQSFDLIQMSLVDTFAATGAGAFTLSESGLYTTEGWLHFLQALSPDGLFTVSRFFSPSNSDEAARTYVLALASLMQLGVTHPADHVYMAAVGNIATLVIGRAPLSTQDITRLEDWSAARGYTVIARPGQTPHSSLLAAIANAKTENELEEIAAKAPLDVSAPTDNRPFFFNQLRLRDVFWLEALTTDKNQDGVVSGNLKATYALLGIILASALAILGLLLLPAYSSVAKVAIRLALPGTIYFLLIGLGFMLVEMALIQRLSLFLGHPTYAMAIVLFSLILVTGLGSFASTALNLTAYPCRLVIYSLLTSGLIIGYVFLMPPWLAHYEGASLAIRAGLALCAIAPAAFLMGLAFPNGMQMVTACDEAPTPWFWAINGAAGVFASGLAVLLSLSWGISATLIAGALCYLFLALPALGLRRLTQTA
jgi:spermidine synthase